MTAFLILSCLAAEPAAPRVSDYFRITVVDAETGRGVPLVELTTTNQICHVTDSNGVVAFHEPGPMDRKVFFQVTSHGYEFAKHPYFDQEEGRVIYFEGTYTHTFSGNPAQTPRYDYNQVMYQLDLADERLELSD